MSLCPFSVEGVGEDEDGASDEAQRIGMVRNVALHRTGAIWRG